MTDLHPLPSLIVESAVRAALAEDLGDAGDITSQSTVPADTRSRVVLRARDHGCIAGLDAARAAFREMDPGLRISVQAPDGSVVAPGDVIAAIEGNARAIVTGERVALNFLGHLSGIATATRKFVDAVSGTNTRICCTRKTTPGLRAFEKYAVRAGGGVNHRFGLYDAILIKDNHIAMAGGIAEAISGARAKAGHMVRIEIEVDTLDQLTEALDIGVEAVLLDNMPPAVLSEAVDINQGRAALEASGGITLDTAAGVAATGVDYISVGWITHSAPCLDIGLDYEAAAS
ncbi:MAG: nicotinate-nucleotide diphosphorylase (carboxylating) [Parvibaculum sp.]|nr:nicotinate-nucleotide diphosphorylase (carboxylating) [Parvibaculum sp.]|tara:strand:+ start:3821 stop:4684 length:864 start_codon:yes stop_codon:yes gene_type:complete